MTDTEHVRIDIECLGLCLLGTLLEEKDGSCIVRGLVHGSLSGRDRELIDITEMEGISDKNGWICLQKIIWQNLTVPDNTEAPSSFSLRSLLRYDGDFDPRVRTVGAVEAEIGSQTPICNDRLAKTRTDMASMAVVTEYPIRPEPIVLFDSGTLRVTLDRRGSFSQSVTYREVISVAHSEPTNHFVSDKIIDSVFELLSIITQGNIIPQLRTYVAPNAAAHEIAHRFDAVAQVQPTSVPRQTLCNLFRV